MRSLFLFLLLLIPLARGETSTPNTGDQIQAFTFGFTTSNLVLPIAYTCPTPLTLTQLTTTNAATDDPASPYTMVMIVHEQLMDGAGIQYERIYTASLNVGDMSQTQSISHPWGNGTQFIACIWGSNGASGGCQDLITVVPSADLTAEAYENTTSTCRAPDVLGSWVTPANATLDVEVTGATGQVSENAWPASCSDLKFMPKNGTAPYTLLIAPAAHPPVNVTSGSGSAADNSMNYTVRLTHGQAFMAAIYDSAGNSWAVGPFHAGTSDDLSCLAVATGQEVAVKSSGFGLGEFVGGVVGAFAVGALGALVLMWLLNRRRKTKRSVFDGDLYANPRAASYHNNSDSIYGKPMMDSPRTEFDTPATLYDPHVPGPYDTYPQRPLSGTLASSQARGDPFSSPSLRDGDRADPAYLHNGDRAEGYYDGIALADFHPTTSPGPPRSIASGRTAPLSPRILGHQHETSRDSLLSTHQSPEREREISAQRNSASANARRSFGSLPLLSSSPREGSFHSLPSDRNRRQGSPVPPVSPALSERRVGLGVARNIYVVHSDAAGGDVHIQLPEEGANVIELPPNYRSTPSPRPRSLPSPRLPDGAIDRRDYFSSIGPNASARTSSPLDNQQQRFSMPYAQLEPTRSRGSVISNFDSPAHEEELRARAQAAMRDKDRVLGLT